MKIIQPHLIVCILAFSVTVPAQITVFAASSTTEAMKEIRKGFGNKIRFNFASSGTLARQIEAGAPADIFISANVQWMDYLEKQTAIRTSTRINLATNSLVLIAPKGSELAFDGNIPGRLAVGEFKSVPAGIYAKEALEHMGWLELLKPNLLMGANARIALMYVERGEAAAGIVYASDAKASNKVTILGIFPEDSHSPIVYPVAACSTNEGVEAFLTFLQSAKAQSIMRKHGFK